MGSADRDVTHFGIPEGFICTITALESGWKASIGATESYGDTIEVAMRRLYARTRP